jgi:hypothetical protein
MTIDKNDKTIFMDGSMSHYNKSNSMVCMIKVTTAS